MDIVDGGDYGISAQLKQHQSFFEGADRVLELVGPDKTYIAFACKKPFGRVCVTGVLTKVRTLK